jgi:hypothetical protein
MGRILRFVGVFVPWLGFLSSAFAQESYRVLILDGISSGPANHQSRILTFDTDTGKKLAQAETGYHPDVAVSARGDLVGVLTNETHGQEIRDQSGLILFKSRDLTRLRGGALLSPRNVRQSSWSPFPRLLFSPDSREIVVQYREFALTDEKPKPRTFDQVLLSCVNLSSGPDVMLAFSRRTVAIPRCRFVVFLRVEDWPRITVWNDNLGAVEVIDFDRGEVLSRTSMDDAPDFKQANILVFEKPNLGKATTRLSSPRGETIPAGGRFAYYIPKRHSHGELCFLKRIELENEFPTTVLQSSGLQTDLRPIVAAATEAGHALFVVKNEIRGAAQVKSHLVKRFRTDSLAPQDDIDLPLESCDYLEVSRDGKQVYALDRKNARLAVIDVLSGRIIKVHDKVADLPLAVFALPSVWPG